MRGLSPGVVREMARRAPKPCRAPLCSALSTDGSGYCEAHLNSDGSLVGNAFDEIAALLRPDISPPGVPVTVVAGCPGAGKSAYVETHAAIGDIVIDLDQIKSELSGNLVHQTGSEPELLRAALLERNSRLGALASANTGRAWLVCGAPTVLERRHWRRVLRAEIVVLETPVLIAAERMRKDRTRTGQAAAMTGWAQRWWSQYVADSLDTIIKAD